MATRNFLYMNQTEGFVQEQATADSLSIGSLNLVGVSGLGIQLNGNTLLGVPTPVNATDGANKAYVDATANGITWKNAVYAATAAALPAYTYNNGSSGVGATLTGTANAALTIDGQTLSVGERVLVKNETGSNAPYNGIYSVTQVGASGSAPYILTRTTDFNSSSTVAEGDAVFAGQGTVNASTAWVVTPLSTVPPTIGTTNIVLTQFGAVLTYTAGQGIYITGTTIEADPSDGLHFTSAAGQSGGTNGFAINLTASNPGLQLSGTSPNKTLGALADGTHGITIASAGVQAKVGGTAEGIVFDGSGNIEWAPYSSGGLQNSSNGASILLPSSSGLQTGASGLSVLLETNPGLTLSSTGLAVLLATNPGLQLTSSGLSVLLNNGSLSSLSTGLTVNYAPAVVAYYVANASVSAGNAVCWSSTNDQITAGANTALATSHVIGVAPSAISATASGQVVSAGVCAGVLSGATVNTPYYLGPSGALVQYSSLTSGARVVQVGFSKNATDLWVEIRDFGQKQ